MIGKMADEKEFDEKAASSDSEEGDDDEEDMTNGKNDVGDDESEFDDPEEFVDDVTDEGKVLRSRTRRVFGAKPRPVITFAWLFDSLVQLRGQHENFLDKKVFLVSPLFFA